MTRGPLPRADAFSDHRNWQDTGCEVAPRCLECPLPACRYDVAGGARHLLNIARDDEIRQRLSAGESAPAVAARFGLGVRTVYRVNAGT